MVRGGGGQFVPEGTRGRTAWCCSPAGNCQRGQLEERGSSFRRVGLKPSETARSVGSAAGVCVWGRGVGGQQAS